MDFFVNLGDTTLKTPYCRKNKSIKIWLQTGQGKDEKYLIEIFGIPRNCKSNLYLTDYEMTTMDDKYIAIKPFIPVKKSDTSDRITMIILPTSPLDEKPYQDPRQNLYQHYIRESTVNTKFFMFFYPNGNRVYEKLFYIYDLSFDKGIKKYELLAGIQHREISGKKLNT